MRTLGNMLWFVLGGWWSGTVYMLLGAVFYITIIGIPIGRAMFEYGKLMYFPFGKSIVRESFIKGKENISPIKTVFQTILNLIWLPFGISLFAVNIGLMLICFISIIFIPYGIVLARSCKFLLWPIGARVIKKEQEQAIYVANELEKRGIVGRSASAAQPANAAQTTNVNVSVNLEMPAQAALIKNQEKDQEQAGVKCSCNYVNPTDSKFCGECGSQLHIVLTSQNQQQDQQQDQHQKW